MIQYGKGTITCGFLENEKRVPENFGSQKTKKAQNVVFIIKLGR
jgi:hypothetical protein